MQKPFQKSSTGTDQFRTYASYRSSRQTPRPQPINKRRRLLFVLLGMLAASAVWYWQHSGRVSPEQPVLTNQAAKSATVPAPNHCANNTLGKFISISITDRHMWVCEQTKQVYDSPVITGMQNLAADLTPPGTYHIYAKQTDLTLSGSDSTGSWNDPVSYWMPFLSNQYGVYGFHDATWRPDSEFGTIDPYSNKGSHGCVELPLATSRWLYNWSQVGTTLSVIS